MRRVLFVCTGNIFRSLTAEYALRAVLPENAGIHV
jgi:protein-tyrosine-phosphatase